MKYLVVLVMALAVTNPSWGSVLAHDSASNYMPPNSWGDNTQGGTGFASPWLTQKSTGSSQSIGSSDVDVNGVSFMLAASSTQSILVYRTFDNTNGFLGVGQTFYGMLDPLAYNTDNARLSVNLTNTVGADALSLYASKVPFAGSPVDSTPTYWIGPMGIDTGVLADQAVSFEFARLTATTHRITVTPLGGSPVVITETRNLGDVYGFDVTAFRGNLGFNNVGVGTVPEPACLGLAGLAVAALGFGRRRR